MLNQREARHRVNTRAALVAVTFSILAFPFFSYAAQGSLFLSPPSGTYTTGKEFTASVVMSTGGVSVNATEATIKYSPEDLTVVRIDRTKSPIASWTIEPDFQTEEGVVKFGGIIPDGLSADGIKLLSITFVPKRSGETRVRIASGAAVLASDGNGTNILTDLRGGAYTLNAREDYTEALTGGPSLVRSSTHPDPNAWYASRDVSLEWSRSVNTESMRFSIDENPEGAPNTVLDGTSSGKNVSLEDGVWYAHLAMRDDSGWGPIGHHRVQIDTERPSSLAISELARTDLTDARPTIIVSATDARSGISHYEFAVDGGGSTRWEDDGNHRYQLPPLLPGNHVVSVRVFDRAGNSLSDTLPIIVVPLPTPVFTELQTEVFAGNDLDVAGTALPDTTLRVAITYETGDTKTEEVVVGPNGNFLHTFVFPQTGNYRLKASVIDKRGSQSMETPEVLIRVSAASLLGAIGAVGSFPSVLMALVFMVIGVMVGMTYATQRSPRTAPAIAKGRFSGLGGSVVQFIRSRFVFSSEKAETEVGASVTPTEDGVQNISTPQLITPHQVSLAKRDAQSSSVPHVPTVLGRTR